MNILFICDEYPPGRIGGIGSITGLTAKWLAEQGHKIFVVGLYPHGYGQPDYEDAHGIRVYRLRYFSDFTILFGNPGSIKYKILIKLLRATGLMAIDARFSFSLFKTTIESIVKSEKIDVIEMPEWNDFFFNLRPRDFILPSYGIPLVVKLHGSLSMLRFSRKLKPNKRVLSHEKYLLKRADGICAVSNYARSFYKEYYRLEVPIETLYNGVEVRKFISAKNRINEHMVIFSGSLVQNKGIFSLMHAWNKVIKVLPTASLQVFGKGDSANAARILSPEAKEKVTFFGHVDRERLYEALSTTDIAVFPSYSETFGLGAVEAMSTGCPVIFTKRSSGPEIGKDGQDLVLIDPDDHNDLASKIILLLTNSDLRENIGYAGYLRVKNNFDISITALKQVSYYNKLITAFHGNRPRSL